MWEFFINLLLLSNVVTIWTCPETCICRNYPSETLESDCYKTIVKCEGFNTSFTWPNTTNQLEVSNVNENDICLFVNSLNELKLLESLLIRTSDVRDVSKCFGNLTGTITRLKLPQNNLSVFSETFSNSNSKLRLLDLSENSITSVGKIKSLKSLETLNLSENAISQINFDSFSELESLKILDLSKNNLSTLNKELFTRLTKLKLLNLSYNSIKSLQQDCFNDLLILEQLDLSFNDLIKVNLESLELPNLTSLYLTGNKQLGKLHKLLVGASRKLKFVDASKAALDKIPGALTHSVRTLKLTKNNMKSINCGELDAYPLLQILNLDSNKIQFVEEDSFGRLEFLTTLHVADNKLPEIPKSLPTQIIILHLQSNNIQRVNKQDLKGLFVLELLNLRDNKITFIEEEALSNLTSLVTLDLSQNPISILGPNSLSGPLSLQTLRLSAIGTISPAKDVSFPLLAPENLVALDLSQSAGLARQMLHDEAFLDAAKLLQEIDLSNNEMETIRSDIFHFLPQLRVLKIHNNPLNCTGMEWLSAWMRRQDNTQYNSIICFQPTYLKGLPLVDLQYSDAPSITTINQVTKPINQLRKTSTTTSYQPGQYGDGQRTSYEITIGGKNNDNRERTAQELRKVQSSSKRKLTLEKENQSVADDKSESSGDFSTIEHTQNPLLISTEFPNKTNAVPESWNDTKFGLNNTKPMSRMTTSEAASVKPTSNRNYTVDVPLRSRSHLGNTFVNINPLFGEARDGNKLNQVAEDNISIKTKGSGANIISTYENTDIKKLVGNNELQSKSLMKSESRLDHEPKLSMYVDKNETPTFLHPGMIILTVGVLSGVVTLIFLATKMKKDRRLPANALCREDVENIDVSDVSTLPNVTDLW